MSQILPNNLASILSSVQLVLAVNSTGGSIDAFTNYFPSGTVGTPATTYLNGITTWANTSGTSLLSPSGISSDSSGNLTANSVTTKTVSTNTINANGAAYVYINSAMSQGSGNVVSGLFAAAEGIGCQALGNGSLAVGHLSIASTNYAFAQGDGSQAAGNGSSALGFQTQAMAAYSHSEGFTTICNVNAPESHAEGENTQTFARAAHAEGLNCIASGDSSHAQGYMTYAQGAYSHSEGQNSIAYGDISHAQGWGSTATGIASFAGGINSNATGYNSFALGSGANATATGSWAFCDTTGKGITNAIANSLVMSFANGVVLPSGTPLIMQSNNGIYWNLNMSNSGTLVITSGTY